MKIAVLSGKGGTGKTFVSVNLARMFQTSIYMDCDVEEPNGALFLKPLQCKTKDVFVEVPVFDSDKCMGCRACVNFCKFHALAFIKERPMLFQEVCHNCGGCQLVCQSDAVTFQKKKVGEVSIGQANQVLCLSGKMEQGQASGIPVIKELFHQYENLHSSAPAVIDCPPGSGCMVMESIKDVDYCILVTEPTTFAVHNLNMIVKLVTLYNKPFGVVINKDIRGFNPAQEYCSEFNIPVLEKIPFRKDIAKKNAVCENVLFEEDKDNMEGRLLQAGEKRQSLSSLFQSIKDKVVEECKSC